MKRKMQKVQFTRIYTGENTPLEKNRQLALLADAQQKLAPFGCVTEYGAGRTDFSRILIDADQIKAAEAKFKTALNGALITI